MWGMLLVSLLIVNVASARAPAAHQQRRTPASAGAAARAAAAAALASAAAPSAPPPCLPLLRPGTLFGAQYSKPSGAAGNATDTLFAQLAAKGATLLQLSLPWADIETTPNQPNFLLIAELLHEAHAAGLTPLFQIAAIDTEHASVPADLANPLDPTRLRSDLAWNSTEVVDRFALLMEVVAPLAAFAGAPYIGVGNEVSVNLGLHPETGYAFAEFLFIMRSWVKQLTTPTMGVGVTMTVGDLNSWAPPSTPPAWAETLLAIGDVTPLTYYPLRDDFSVDDPASIERTFEDALSVLPPSACLVLQELGCPSGYNNASSTDGSNQTVQAAFVTQMGKVLRGVNETRAVRAVSWFQLVDMTDTDCEGLTRYYNTTDPRFVEYLCTLGLVKNTGKPKSAWATFLGAFV
jgi:hypothetical protein